MTPIDQTSTSLSYGCWASTSGAAHTKTHATAISSTYLRKRVDYGSYAHNKWQMFRNDKMKMPKNDDKQCQNHFQTI